MLIIVNTPNGRQLQAISNGEVNLLREESTATGEESTNPQMAGSLFQDGTDGKTYRGCYSVTVVTVVKSLCELPKIILYIFIYI